MEPSIVFRPIGILRSEHREAAKTPIQPAYAKDCLGRAEIFPEFTEGLRDVEGFSHLYLIFHLDRAGPARLTVKPFLQDVERGVFCPGAGVCPRSGPAACGRDRS
ncbi:MAG: SAM-dependent methyltransferase [Phycisphaerae bacterium]|nr:SAM-dependent methyltransferase [Phycisphaerae bacterium]